jgi:hypothetical protein
MDEREVYAEFNLNIKHYKGDQTREELLHICEKCLFRDDLQCLVFNVPTRESQRMCINNYRIDRETLTDAMHRKLVVDNEVWNKWIASFPDFMGKDEDDAKLYVIKSPDDMVQVHEDLEKILGE